MSFEEQLYNLCKEKVNSFSGEKIYAISFFVYCNDDNVYKGIRNFPFFSVGYNTESDCNKAPKYSEKRWNFAFWSQNNVSIIDSKSITMSDMLLDWYKSKGISTNDLGEMLEDEYDEDMNYIGKGPKGYYEFLMLVSNIAKRMQLENIIKNRFGAIPIIVHDLEYPWFVKEATINANPHGEAKIFLHAYKKLFE